jgi:hypothetical protein
MTMLKRLLGAAVAGGVILAAPMAAPSVAQAKSDATSITHHKAGYTITLKLLPAEPWTKDGASTPSGEMQYLSGADPVKLNNAIQPNHHLVVFLRKGGHPVEHADVRIRYKGPGVKHTNWTKERWIDEPVVRMDVSGVGAKTTHYGNNVFLKPGVYLVDVTIDKKIDSRFKLQVH